MRKLNQPDPATKEQITTSYGEILTLYPCAAGLRGFVHAVGGISKAKEMKNFNVAWIKHIDSEAHMEWVMARKRIPYLTQLLIELAWDLSAKDPDVIKCRIKAANKLLGAGPTPRKKKE